MVSYLKRLIRWAKVVKAGADTGQFPVQQVTYLGKAGDAVMIFPYGMHANVDDGLALMVAVGGDAENRGAVPTSMTRRSKLASGDVEFYSPVSRSRVTFRANGDIEADAKRDLIATVAGDASVDVGGDTSLTVGGNLTATVTGDASVSATNVDIDASASATITSPTITLDGDVTITQALAVTGNSTFTGTMTNGGKDVGYTHGHTQGLDSNGDSEAPISGVT